MTRAALLSRESFVELGARERARALLDPGTFRELAGPFDVSATRAHKCSVRLISITSMGCESQIGARRAFRGPLLSIPKSEWCVDSLPAHT